MAAWGEPRGLTARPKRRFGNKVQWVVNLDTGRFGDIIVVEIEEGATEQDVLKTLTRTQRKKATSCKLVTRFRQEAA
jgi:hypothetical protein